MNVNKYNCILCHYPFDNSIHLPRLLSDCGHSVCSLCLSKASLHKSRTFICPKDNTIYSNIDNIYNFKINQLILDNIKEYNKNNYENYKLLKNESKKSLKTHKSSRMKIDTASFTETLLTSNLILNNNSNSNLNTNISNININSPRCYVKKTIKFNQNKKINISDNSSICLIHSLPLNVICVNDHQKICGQCALNNEHLEHQIITEQKFIEYVDELVKVFQQIENNQNNNIEVSDIKTNIILEKIENKIERSKNKIKKICVDLIENINIQFRQIEKFLDLRKNEIINKFNSINYNILNLKESADNWMGIISNKLIEANTGTLEDINLDCLKLLDKDPNKNIFNLINTGKQLNERYNFIKDTKDMIEKLNKFSQSGLNIIPNNSIIDGIKSISIINEPNSKLKHNRSYNQNVMTTTDNRDRNNIYKNMKINLNVINKNNIETPLFKIEEDKDLIDGLHLTPIIALNEQIKYSNSAIIAENSLLSDNSQGNSISNLSNLFSSRNKNIEILNNINSNHKVYSKKKLDDFYSKEYIINFKNINESKTKTQTKFYQSNKIKNYLESEQSPENKLYLSGSVPRYNTQYFNNTKTPLSPISKKDLFPKLIQEKACDIAFIATKKRRNSSDALVINNNINTLFKPQNISLNNMTLSPRLTNTYDIVNNLTNNLSTKKEFRTVEKYQNKNSNNYKANSGNKNKKNKNRVNSKAKIKFTRCASCSGSLINKKELNDIHIMFNSKKRNKIDYGINLNNSHSKKAIKNDISDISNITNNINKSTTNARRVNKISYNEISTKSINTNQNNNTANITVNNTNTNASTNNKNISCITKDTSELKEIIEVQMKNTNPNFSHINMKGEGVQFLSDFFKKNKNKKYKEMKLIRCNLNDDDFSLLIKNIIESEIEIGTLNATYNQLGDNSFKCICEIVKKIKGLKSIFLYNNSFSKGFKDKIKINDKDNSLYNVRLYL